MEPDIIRMYSSSPPPLDNGTEDDDEDEFGEFGEFNEVESSSVGFADIDAPSYPNSKDVFIPPNLFMPIHDYSDINNFSCSKMDQDCCAEFSGSALGQSDLLETITCNQIKPSRTSNSPCDDRPSPSCKIKPEYFVKQERMSPETLHSEGINSNLDLQISNCNGNKVPSLEILTNGFAVLDSVDPQGIENLDVGSPSKELNALSTKLSLNSLHSSCEIDTLSNRSTALLEEIDHQAHTQSSDGGVLKNQDNNGLIKLVPQRTVADSTSDENKDLVELDSVEVCLSNANGSRQQKEDTRVLSPLSLECSSTLPMNSKSIEHYSGSDDGSNEVANEGRVNGHVHSSRTDYSTEIVNGSSEITNEADLLSQTKPISIVHTEMVTLDGIENVTNTELGKDFITLPVTSEGSVETVIHTVLPTFGDAEKPTRSMPLKGTLEQFPQVSTLGGDNDESRHFSGNLHCESSAFDTVPKLTLNMFPDVQDTKNKYSDFPLDDKGEEDDGEFGEFGDFDSVPKTQEKMDSFQDFDDFADFSSASCNQSVEWKAFEAEQKGSAWATFDEQPPVDSMDNKEEPWQPHRTEMPITSDCDQVSIGTVLSISDKLESAVHGSESAAAFQTSLIGRLERIFQVCFPSFAVPTEEETVATLKVLLEHGEKLTEKESTSESSLEDSGKQMEVWMKLQNIHDGYGLRYQWGGSHSNKMLLRSLGIDTRNILFTGNKKQPVIVPMYASGLGMLEPTKEPLKPVSAAEKITSIGHTPPVSPEIAPSDQLQESLPPVQFDWSSSGLTNPLDASGGATLLNLDFFGPVDDSSCSSTTTIPGVDPELYELTTSKLENSNTSSKVTDAFAKLMSTVEKTSTSTRKPKKEEHLSEEAAKVIASLPDLSFMHAKVLMFPTTLTPSTGSQQKVD